MINVKLLQTKQQVVFALLLVNALMQEGRLKVTAQMVLEFVVISGKHTQSTISTLFELHSQIEPNPE